MYDTQDHTLYLLGCRPACHNCEITDPLKPQWNFVRNEHVICFFLCVCIDMSMHAGINFIWGIAKHQIILGFQLPDPKSAFGTVDQRK